MSKEKRTQIGFIDLDYWQLHVLVESDDGTTLTPTVYGDEVWLSYLIMMSREWMEQEYYEQDLNELLDELIYSDSPAWRKKKT